MTVAERLSPEMEAEWRARFLAERPGRWGKRRQVARELARLMQCHESYAYGLLRDGRDGWRERRKTACRRHYRKTVEAGKREASGGGDPGGRRSWADGSARAHDDEIMTAKRKPAGCSDARWRIELRRRRMVRSGGECAFDPDEEYRWVH